MKKSALSKWIPRRHPGSEVGQTTVEFVMIIPALIIVTLALCQTALALCCYLGIHHSSREGARKGVESNDYELAKRYARSAASWLPGAKDNLEVSIDCPQGRDRGDPMKVEVSYKMPILFPLLENIIPGEIRFSHTTTMHIENSHPR